MKTACQLAAVVVVSVSLGNNAWAQADPNARALAVQLFDEAQALTAQGQIAAACPKLAESYRLDPQLGALMHLAECYEKNGQIASAWGSFREAAELAEKRADERFELAQQRFAALEPRLSRLIIQVSEAARVEGLAILRSGTRVAEALWGTPTALDAGKYVIAVSAPGYGAWQSEVTVSDEGRTVTVEIPILAKLPATNPEPTPRAGPARPAVVSTADSSPADAAPGSSQRMAAIAVGGLGIVGLGVGGFVGLSARASVSDSNAHCNDGNFCTAQGVELRDDARGKALVATIAAGVGAAAMVTAAVLWFTAPKRTSHAKRAATPPRLLVTSARAGLGLEVTRAF